MPQHGCSPFQLPQHHPSVLYGDVLKTPTTARERVSLDSPASLTSHLGLDSGSSTSSDRYLLSSTLYPHASPASLSSETSETYAYNQLVLKYQYSEEELKKTRQDYERLKYVSF